MATEFVTTKRVEFAHTDMGGIVHFSQYFCYMEETEHAFFRSVGMTVYKKNEGRIVTWPRVACSFDFQAPLHFEDEFEIRLTIKRLGSKSLTYKVEMRLDDRLVASGETTSVCCAIEADGTIHSIPIPPAMRAALGEGAT